MNRLSHKLEKLRLRKNRTRSNIIGTAERPRLSVNVSNLHVTAQVIDDTTHKTLAYVSTVGKKDLPKTMTERAEWVGTEVAKKAKAAKVKKVAYDRGGRAYHGRVKALADAARKAGLEF
jgi:large subunit ribosomal protein L18